MRGNLKKVIEGITLDSRNTDVEPDLKHLYAPDLRRKTVT